jgi:hypothetical protein
VCPDGHRCGKWHIPVEMPEVRVVIVVASAVPDVVAEEPTLLRKNDSTNNRVVNTENLFRGIVICLRIL